ncbi:hematopoietic progenitor cell antigen CD34 isoform X2 [Carettochelys insculpta]|uniref:hematopoietic progenitor cell antigen CD34 isoform X2 n=1 Tax=Carettochelys insculpta TaxID=44489 RepID=UPI003EBEEECB
MLILRSLKTMKRKQLFWTLFCILSLMYNKVSGQNVSNSSTTTSPSESYAAITDVTSAMTTAILTELMIASEPASSSATLAASTAEMTTMTEDSSSVTSTEPKQMPTNVSDVSVNTSSTLWPESERLIGKEVTLRATTFTSEQTSYAATAGPTTSSPEHNIICQDIKHVTRPNGICLYLSESITCNEFIWRKGVELSRVLCGTNGIPKQCPIKLAQSEVKPSCMLLLQAGDKGADVIQDLKAQEDDLAKLGIKSHKLESIKCHQQFSRKTLIALVTSGLLLAFLGLAGYFFKKRWSWSPMGERLANRKTENLVSLKLWMGKWRSSTYFCLAVRTHLGRLLQRH